MKDIAEVAKLTLLLERILRERGLLDQEQFDVTALPVDLQKRMGRLIENASELQGLLRIGHAARLGEALSPPVLEATRVMVQEVCEALLDRDKIQIESTVH
ncbi:hypothetical protein [Neorhizobium sp. T7_12]|uniref:hypothetical protein n=1 Tax=Neorhizobium sp. T7_12 TaxID=2093832 RepID=UPI000CF933A0|nr:hypothetical protein [Neorhizobium sp. T7_12]